MAVELEIREITPQDALKMLENNTGNRIVRQSRVAMYARDMKAGRWKINGIPIILNGTKIQDGQHRLLACVQANKAFKTAIATGVTDESHRTIDTGANRTTADELRWMGESNAPELAAILNLLFRHANNMLSDGSLVASRAELIGMLKQQPTIRDSIAAGRVGKDLRIRATSLGAAHHLLATEHGQGTARIYLNHLGSGVDYTDGDPCLALRNLAMNVAGRTSLRPSTVEWFAYCVKSMNAFLLGREIRNLSWRRIGPKRESFPALVTFDEVGEYETD